MSEKKRWKILRSIGYLIPILLVVYVISIGPVAAFVLDSNGNIEREEYEDFVLSFYAPLEWCADRFTFVRDFFRIYIEFCNGTETFR